MYNYAILILLLWKPHNTPSKEKKCIIFHGNLNLFDIISFWRHFLLKLCTQFSDHWTLDTYSIFCLVTRYGGTLHVYCDSPGDNKRCHFVLTVFISKNICLFGNFVLFNCYDVSDFKKIFESVHFNMQNVNISLKNWFFQHSTNVSILALLIAIVNFLACWKKGC